MTSPTKRHFRKLSALVAPEISHLQAFLLFELSAGERRGKALRMALKKEGIEHRYEPTFHACIRRLLDANPPLITRHSVPTKGAPGHETAYALTAAGRAALKELRSFYRRMERKAKRRR